MCCKENKCFAAFVLVGIYAPTRILLYIEGYSFGKTTKEGGFMVIKIDFQSEEALYMQLRNQIILGIATSVIQEGDSLPSVRQLAGDIGINMHTVNKAYSLLRQEGFLTIDRRKGAVIALDVDKMEAINEIKKNLRVILAKAHCKNIQQTKCMSWLMRFSQNTSRYDQMMLRS